MGKLSDQILALHDAMNLNAQEAIRLVEMRAAIHFGEWSVVNAVVSGDQSGTVREYSCEQDGLRFVLLRAQIADTIEFSAHVEPVAPLDSRTRLVLNQSPLAAELFSTLQAKIEDQATLSTIGAALASLRARFVTVLQ